MRTPWPAGPVARAMRGALRQVLGVDVIRKVGAAASEAATAQGDFFVDASRVVDVDTTAVGDRFGGRARARVVSEAHL